MYQNIVYDKQQNLIHIWDDEKGYFCIPFQKYAYKISSHGEFETLYGQKVTKVIDWSQEDIDRGFIYESDISPETRTLIDLYYESDVSSNNHRVLFIDIEVDSSNGFASPQTAENEITAICQYDVKNNIYFAFILDKEGSLPDIQKDNKDIKFFKTEYDLLIAFLKNWRQIDPTIVSGWNIDTYDIPYIYNRLSKVFNENIANTLSPINLVRKYKSLMNKNDEDSVIFGYSIGGISCLDYMRLYKLFTAGERPSYSLNAISTSELGHGKTEYTGSLDNLFKTDLNKFITYNINDVVLCVELDNKLKFIDLARAVCHKGHVAYENIYMTTRYIDGACLTYMKRNNIIAPNKKRRNTGTSQQYEGAFVKEPIPGLYKWIFDEDMASLYPSAIRTINISPETKRAKVDNWKDIKQKFIINSLDPCNINISFFNSIKHIIFTSIKEFREYLDSNNFTISITGIIYDFSKEGLVPSVLNKWMKERNDYKALSKKYGKEGDSVQCDFYDQRQHAMKIVNNSLYGAMGMDGFRFHDVDNAESITLSGQAIIQHVMLKGNEWIHTKVDPNSGDNIIYVDTDSIFMSAVPVIQKLETKAGKELTYEEKASITFKTSQTIENYINNDWDRFAKDTFNTSKHVLNIKQEYVSESGFWLAKKHYACRIISEKGVLIKEKSGGKKDAELDIKGLDIIKANFPRAFKNSVSEILVSILKGKNKEYIDELVLKLQKDIPILPLYDIMFSTGVKDIKKYIDTKNSKGIVSSFIKGTPVHVKAVNYYNNLIKYFKQQNTYGYIQLGDKCKWTYLKENNKFHIRCIALKGYDDSPDVIQFVKDNIDYETIFDSCLKNKLTDFYSALHWGSLPNISVNIGEFFI